MTSAQPQRIAKLMASAGLCSRREAERWIAQGRVTVNGEVLESPARTVTQADRVEVDGERVAGPQPLQLWRYHKPRGLVTTHADPEDRPTVFSALPPSLPRVISIGRLDLTTEGLLLLTTSGTLARHLELPATGWLRRYRVRARGTVTQAQLDGLANGMTVDGTRYGEIVASLDENQRKTSGGKPANVWMSVALREGKNREIRKVMAALGLEVNRLIRLSYGPFQLGDLAIGDLAEIPAATLAEQLDRETCNQLGLAKPKTSPAKPKNQERHSRARSASGEGRTQKGQRKRQEKRHQGPSPGRKRP